MKLLLASTAPPSSTRENSRRRSKTVTGVRTRDSQTDVPVEQGVRVIEQKLNPDYPKTTPRGGTGKGIWTR